MATQKLIMGFVTLIIGISLLGVVATGSSDVTTKDVTQNESFVLTDMLGPDNNTEANVTVTQDVANAYTSTDWQWNDGECTIDVTLLAMINATPATEGTDFNVTANGAVALMNTTFWSLGDIDTNLNVTMISYTYCGDDYMSLGWGRSIISLIPGFFAIALLMVSVALFYSVAKDTGLF